MLRGGRSNAHAVARSEAVNLGQLGYRSVSEMSRMVTLVRVRENVNAIRARLSAPTGRAGEKAE
jgi:hypothetical protein